MNAYLALTALGLVMTLAGVVGYLTETRVEVVKTLTVNRVEIIDNATGKTIYVGSEGGSVSKEWRLVPRKGKPE